MVKAGFDDYKAWTNENIDLMFRSFNVVLQCLQNVN
jgi:hypothetical protein